MLAMVIGRVLGTVTIAGIALAIVVYAVMQVAPVNPANLGLFLNTLGF